jgi:ferredoxin
MGLVIGRDVDGEHAEGVLVRTHPGLCLGWGNCHRFAPDVYPLDNEGKVDIHRLAVPADQAYDAWVGAAACPERAITVIGGTMRSWAERRAGEREATDVAEAGTTPS